MNIGFYDPISERWIKPRMPEPKAASSWAEVIAANNALAEQAALAAQRQVEAERIWQITRQVAEGCNAPTREPFEPCEHQALSNSEAEAIDAAVNGATKPATIEWSGPPQWRAAYEVFMQQVSCLSATHEH